MNTAIVGILILMGLFFLNHRLNKQSQKNQVRLFDRQTARNLLVVLRASMKVKVRDWQKLTEEQQKHAKDVIRGFIEKLNFTASEIDSSDKELEELGILPRGR